MDTRDVRESTMYIVLDERNNTRHMGYLVDDFFISKDFEKPIPKSEIAPYFGTDAKYTFVKRVDSHFERRLRRYAEIDPNMTEERIKHFVERHERINALCDRVDEILEGSKKLREEMHEALEVEGI